jgi:N6-L-threonylcarbamoyladenine synthase
LKGKANEEYHFKRIFLPASGDNLYPFSFSGMKSQVSFLLDKIRKGKNADSATGTELTEQDIADIAYEFQEATVEILAKRLLKAAKEHHAQTIAVAGGVSANNRLIEYLEQNVATHFLAPAKKIYSTDNGAMIGVVGILKWKNLV